MDNFNKDTDIRISQEFSEFVNCATRGEYEPVKNSKAEIVAVDNLPSGQTLFTIYMDVMTEDENNDDKDLTDPKIKTKYSFPATVAQVQKMVKLAKKANQAAGIVLPVKPNPNAKPKAVVEEVKVEEEIFDAASNDF